MYRLFFMLLFIAGAARLTAQDIYKDSVRAWQERYVAEHKLAQGNAKKMIHFFAPDSQYKVTARVERIYEADWFKMTTSSKEKKVYRVYANLYFTIEDTTLKIPIYQSQDLMNAPEYSDYLFFPFTDKTNGKQTYSNGRYIDFKINDLEPGTVTIDFNKAYNPYCAYIINQFSCPIPPKQNHIPRLIKAGEMRFGNY